MEGLLNYIIPIVIGFIFVYLVPICTDKLIEYKENKNGKPYSHMHSSKIFGYFLSFTVGVLVSYLGLIYFPLWKFIFLLIFSFIACVGTLVDNKVRIIANEMIILMLVISIPFRLIDGGIIYLLNSIASSIGTFILLVGSFLIFGKFLFKTVPGGAGDLKLMMVMSFLLGYPDLIFGIFITMSVMLAYIVYGLMTHYLTMKSYIPLAGFIMIGIVTGLINKGVNLWMLLEKILRLLS